jgi:transcriptional regulator with XRE-family HTH domain
MKIVLKNSDNFKQLLMMNGFTLRQLGKAVGSSGGYMSQIASGERNPGPKIAKKIVDTVGVEFNDIFFIEGVHKSNQN